MQRIIPFPLHMTPLHGPQSPNETREAPPALNGKVDRRSALRLGIMTASFAAMSVLVGSHGGGHHDEDRKRQLHAHHPEKAALERMWHEGFVERGGEPLLQAMRENLRDPKALQAYFDRMRMAEGMTDMEATFRCMDDRICTCGSCSAGSLVLDVAADGKALYVPPPQVAQRVLHSPIAARTGRRKITYTKHLGGCGGDKIAMGILEARDPKTIGDAEVAEWGRRQGEAVTAALVAQLRGSRPVEFRQLGFRDSAMRGPEQEHAGQVIYVTAHNSRQLDPRFNRLPVGMQLDALMLNQRSLALNLIAGVRILLEHGPHREPILVVGLAEHAVRPQFDAALESAARALPLDHRQRTLVGSVTV
jgi:hypothetical protein